VGLAKYLGVTLWSAASVYGLSDADRKHLFEVSPQEWSAFVLRERENFLVVYNPVHSPARINSDVAHELSHIMLGHELTTAEQTEDGLLLIGNYNKDQEDEANWLAGTLLLPRPALLWMRRRQLTDIAAAAHFHVSSEMLTWRVRMTGVDYQLANT
jgi:Zn-dependent peptidase ImmA (M78 family)